MSSKKVITITAALLLAITLLAASCGGEKVEKQTTTSTGKEVTKTDTQGAQAEYTVIDTGQNACYDNSTEISPPEPGEPFYGQDAQYEGVHPSYQDNGDGTVTDLDTGLMWQKGPGDKKTYDEAVAGASSCTTGGYDDWRLPSIKELYSLILFRGIKPSPEAPDTSGCIPFIDTDYFTFEYGDPSAGDRIIDVQYWSSTEYVSTTMGGDATVFGVNFADGRIKGYPRDRGPGGSPMTEFARYVRGDDYGVNSFTDNGDGTITDAATGLMWSQEDSGKDLNWEEALAWVQEKNSENYLGYSDWRLPDAKELQSIVDYSRSPDTTSSAAIDPVFDCTSITNEAGQTDWPFYWSSTTHANMQGGVKGRLLLLRKGTWVHERAVDGRAWGGVPEERPQGGRPR